VIPPIEVPRRLILAALVGLGAGCASLPDLRYAPGLQEVDLRGDDGDLQARIVAAWRELRERDDVPELRFRVRVENPGATLFTLVPAELELLDAALTPFGPARTDDLPVAVEPGQSATFEAVFPVPEGKELDDFDLSALNLRTRFQGGRWSWSATFQRALRHHHDPYWDSPVRFQFGASWWVH
jgi:hypothetical protein